MDFENLDFFTKGEFSTVAIVDSATSQLSEVSGIFDEDYQDFGEYSEGRKYCLQAQTAELESLKRGDRLTIYGKKYAIVSFEPKQDGKLTSVVLKQDFS